MKVLSHVGSGNSKSFIVVTEEASWMRSETSSRNWNIEDHLPTIYSIFVLEECQLTNLAIFLIYKVNKW